MTAEDDRYRLAMTEAVGRVMAARDPAFGEVPTLAPGDDVTAALVALVNLLRDGGGEAAWGAVVARLEPRP
ncbi:MAG TPA: hypothetical protein VKR22_03215 [Acidimicrobiales bacterium]|nr:hypothetical protein [Acidimicrobiales bacterium]